MFWTVSSVNNVFSFYANIISDKLHTITVYRTVLGVCSSCVECHLFSLVSPIVPCSMINRLIPGCLWPLVSFKQHFDTRYFAFCNLSPPRMFLPLNLLSECWIQHGTIGLLYVTSIYSIRIFYRGVSSLLSLRRLVSWINHLPTVCWSTCWKSTFKQQLGVSLT